MNKGFWNLEPDRATLACGALEATVKPQCPGLGLANVFVDGQSLAGATLLGVELPDNATQPPAIVDVYARGTDLVANYGAAEAWPYGAQVYWRVWIPNQAAVLAAVELIVSVQTQLLDSQPRLLAGTRFPPCDLFRLTSADRGSFVAANASERNHSADERIRESDAAVWRSGCDCTMLRPSAATWTYGEIVHPSGPAETEVVSALAPSELRIQHQLFAERLEKGVILRARVLAAFVDRSRERLQLATLYREFAASPPPLTV